MVGGGWWMVAAAAAAVTGSMELSLKGLQKFGHSLRRRVVGLWWLVWMDGGYCHLECSKFGHSLRHRVEGWRGSGRRAWTGGRKGAGVVGGAAAAAVIPVQIPILCYHHSPWPIWRPI